MIIIESNFGDGMFSQLLKPVLTEEVRYPVTIEEVKHSIQKERRIIDTLEPVMNSHKLVVCKSVVEQDISLFKGHYSGLRDSQRSSHSGRDRDRHSGKSLQRHRSGESDTLRDTIVASEIAKEAATVEETGERVTIEIMNIDPLRVTL